jgi:hypothetical protein
MSALSKTFLQCQLPDLGVQRLQIRRRRLIRRVAEDLGRAFHQFTLPVSDLVWKHIEVLRKFRQRFVSLEGRKCHLRL